MEASGRTGRCKGKGTGKGNGKGKHRQKGLGPMAPLARACRGAGAMVATGGSGGIVTKGGDDDDALTPCGHMPLPGVLHPKMCASTLYPQIYDGGL